MIYTLMNQDKETGVSCIEVAKEIDGGVVLTQSKIVPFLYVASTFWRLINQFF